jgi:hypothetical protein
MARAPKKTEDFAIEAAPSDIERRIWILEHALLCKQRAFIADDGSPCCGRCYKPLAEVYDTGCDIEYPEDATDCQHRRVE